MAKLFEFHFVDGICLVIVTWLFNETILFQAKYLAQIIVQGLQVAGRAFGRALKQEYEGLWSWVFETISSVNTGVGIPVTYIYNACASAVNNYCKETSSWDSVLSMNSILVATFAYSCTLPMTVFVIRLSIAKHVSFLDHFNVLCKCWHMISLLHLFVGETGARYVYFSKIGSGRHGLHHEGGRGDVSPQS